MSKEEKERIEGYQKALDADDAEDVAKGKLFNPRQLLLEAKTMQQKYSKKLGLVNYSVLTFDEMLSLGAVTDANERSKTMLWMMLNRAYSDLRKEDVGKLPGAKVAELLTLITKDEGFLPATQEPAPEPLKSGSRRTRTRK